MHLYNFKSKLSSGEIPVPYGDVDYDAIMNLVMRCLDRLYSIDADLFRRNNGDAVCERCLVFRFAHYLQNEIDDYYVDCDFDSSYDFDLEKGTYMPNATKQIPKQDGSTSDRSRYVDIIVHRREPNPKSDLFCIEVKKWNRGTPQEREEDLNKLAYLTSTYNYKLGFFLELGRTKYTTRWTIFQRNIDGSERVIDDQLVFDS